MSIVQIAAIQMVSTAERDANLNTARKLIAQAAHAGARLVVLPENFAYLGHKEADNLALAEADGDGPAQHLLAQLAATYGIWIVGGTIPLRVDGAAQRARAASLVFDAKGKRVARYDKIHLFDVSLPERNERYCESDSTVPGKHPVTVATPFARLGLSVCYDLRFPELYRQLVDEGAQLLTAPSAFTATTGKAHWETLVRARAIENQCYMIAPNQGGTHASGRATYGHSMIVDSWGNILDRVDSGPGIAMAELDLDTLQQTRQRFPSLQHRQL